MSFSAALSSLPHLQVWAHYEERPVEEVMPVLEEKERSASYKPVFVTEITDDLHFYVQDVETGECLCASACVLPLTDPSMGMGPGVDVAGQPGPLRTSGITDSSRGSLRLLGNGFTSRHPWQGWA